VTRATDICSMPRWGFGSPGRLRDELTALALAGAKTGTAGLRVEFELDGEVVPRAGDFSVLIDTAERALAIVETVTCEIVRLADVSDEHAISEGEGYANSAEFRVAHERYWRSYLETLRTRVGDPSFDLSDDTDVVAERFRIVELLNDDGDRFAPRVRPAYPPDRPAVHALLAEYGAELVGRLGELVDARLLPALVAEDPDGVLAGVATWSMPGEALEVVTLHAREQWHGTGTALLAAARRVAEASGAHRLWLITTNDNLDALRFYQRRGLRLVNVHPGAVDRTRSTLKPSIPEVGFFGIALRDEIQLEVPLGGNG
jgi:uncharacterized protein YhfF/N-acetylglutamate synthase-like GNAT family acetyltransferase